VSEVSIQHVTIMQIATENSVTTKMCDSNSSLFCDTKSLKRWQNLSLLYNSQLLWKP